MSGTVFVLTPDTDGTVGGVKVHYQLVDALNASGHPAAIVHGRKGFSCTWFEHRTRVVAADSVELATDDVVVVPEEWVHLIPDLPPGVPVVVFNQNAYTTFVWGVPWEEVAAMYRHEATDRVVVVSNDNLGYLRHAFPELDVRRLRCPVDTERFRPSGPKSKTIAYMPRRRADEATEVLALVGARGALEGWEVVPIVDRSELEVAEILRGAGVFLALGQREGFGLPAAEALACGCIVVGFHGFGGRDIEVGPVWVSDGDVMALAVQLEQILRTWDTDAGRWSELAHTGAASVASEFSMERFRDTAVEAFTGFDRPERTAAAGPMPTSFWKPGSRWPHVVRHLRSAARSLIRGGM